MTTAAFYREQAAHHQSEAEAATLDNVRQRAHEAAKAWTLLADRAAARDAGRGDRTPGGDPEA